MVHAAGDPVTLENLVIGAKVQRGPDWDWDEQDGGIGGIGTLMERDAWTKRKATEGAKWVEVHWEAGDNGCLYRIGGRAKKHDLVYVEGTTRKRKLCEATSQSAQQERLWTQRRFTDAEVVVSREAPLGSKRGGTITSETRFPVHRSTLCSASPVFAATSNYWFFEFWKTQILSY